MVLNSTGPSFDKYPIGNKELNQKVVKFEKLGFISFDDKFGKWSKGKKSPKGVVSDDELEKMLSTAARNIVYKIRDTENKDPKSNPYLNDVEFKGHGEADDYIHDYVVKQNPAIINDDEEYENEIARYHVEEVSTADVLPGGLSDEKPDSDFDLKSVLKGMEVEIEHTNDLDVAKEISKDHLSEDPEYYEKLEAMEQSEVGAGYTLDDAQRDYDNQLPPEDDEDEEPKEKDFYTIYLKENIPADLIESIDEKFDLEVGEVNSKAINVYVTDKAVLSKIIDFIGNDKIVEVA